MMDEKLLVTRDALRAGYESGTVEFVADPMAGSGTVCRIGEHWFFFGGLAAANESPDEYLRHVPVEDVLDEVYSVLEDFREDPAFSDEYQYYACYLRENTGVKVLVSDASGTAILCADKDEAARKVAAMIQEAGCGVEIRIAFI